MHASSDRRGGEEQGGGAWWREQETQILPFPNLKHLSLRKSVESLGGLSRGSRSERAKVER